MGTGRLAGKVAMITGAAGGIGAAAAIELAQEGSVACGGLALCTQDRSTRI